MAQLRTLPVSFAVCLALLMLPGCSTDNGPSTPGTTVNTSELVGAWTSGSGSSAIEFTLSSTTGVFSIGGVEQYRGTYVARSALSPKQLDVTITECARTPSYVGRTALGIYSLEGTVLTFAANEPGVTTRPTQLAQTGSTVVFVLTRQ